jgi:hypothetical protein
LIQELMNKGEVRDLKRDEISCRRQ